MVALALCPCDTFIQSPNDTLADGLDFGDGGFCAGMPVTDRFLQVSTQLLQDLLLALLDFEEDRLCHASVIFAGVNLARSQGALRRLAMHSCAGSIWSSV